MDILTDHIPTHIFMTYPTLVHIMTVSMIDDHQFEHDQHSLDMINLYGIMCFSPPILILR